jgi:hypothetical protein
MTAGGRAPRRFALVLLVSAALLVAAVAGFNAVIDPYGTVGTGVVGPAVWTDRSEKVTLIKRLDASPQLVVYGSSRAMKVEPSYLRRRTGLRAFNAAVSSGRPTDAFVFSRLLDERFGQTPPAQLWLLDQEAFADDTIDSGLLQDPDLAPLLPSAQRLRDRAEGVSWLFSWSTLRTSWRTLTHDEAQAQDPGPEPSGQAPRAQPEFAADGFREWDVNDRRAERGRTLAKGLAASEQVFRGRYEQGYPGLAPTQRDFLERELAAANAAGSTPVIVLSPMHPQLLRVLGPLGWTRLHREATAYLRGLQTEHDFVLLDFSRIESFGGRPRDFFDGVHMKVANYRRLIDAVLADPDARAAIAGGAR